MMEIKQYDTSNQKEVIQLIQQAIRQVSAADYTAAQIKAWASFDPQKWRASVAQHQALVMWDHQKIVGFADMAFDGYLDHLFVHPAYLRQGIAQRLVEALENDVKAQRYTTYASITARPFFSAQGYHVLRENIAESRGEKFLNYYMIKKGVRKQCV